MTHNDDDQPTVTADKTETLDSSVNQNPTGMARLHHLVSQLVGGGEVRTGPEIRFDPEPTRIGNRLIITEDTKIEFVQDNPKSESL